MAEPRPSPSFQPIFISIWKPMFSTTVFPGTLTTVDLLVTVVLVLPTEKTWPSPEGWVVTVVLGSDGFHLGAAIGHKPGQLLGHLPESLTHGLFIPRHQNKVNVTFDLQEMGVIHLLILIIWRDEDTGSWRTRNSKRLARAVRTLTGTAGAKRRVEPWTRVPCPSSSAYLGGAGLFGVCWEFLACSAILASISRFFCAMSSSWRRMFMLILFLF
ncbi:hypothetical protein Z043_118698 [Scleropages formosus]|uniref:Uncharacterized protein n=1 Tax=Scleropages formosus TaxID=113540 RepID=A0A0P7WHK5_SCLFO|nr:hypothetical protein Z043_118698 [Scleropages formosus]